MRLTDFGRDEKEVLTEGINLLKGANEILKYSYETCSKIGIKEEYTFDELDRFEALTSRFSRASDILIQKVFRRIDIIELEGSGTVIDRINRAEKRNIVEDAEKLKKIRRLRNDIAHEYLPEVVSGIFKEVLRMTAILIGDIEKTIEYASALQ
ncbi:hypothetical protein SAMN02745945_00631 [Peptoclostridium litorale DSM 5388]|uniref:Uncharacterized protein n=1 Tax=Peptoclostridium litorale DSM 5388 TaxID=1121324 RepID=A0A069RE31_PEPLI|nr:hypothetical protein [Peptoclostridium litorale]KDR95003.1 hypothetical protein CLIT_11c00300 [Peptoclostridium litorale DSM 5388]SIN76719.1 hypothetical protein SAMN02745945_00631 [Peptoclostridium litorale DSM 5388]